MKKFFIALTLSIVLHIIFFSLVNDTKLKKETKIIKKEGHPKISYIKIKKPKIKEKILLAKNKKQNEIIENLKSIKPIKPKIPEMPILPKIEKLKIKKPSINKNKPVLPIKKPRLQKKEIKSINKIKLAKNIKKKDFLIKKTPDTHKKILKKSNKLENNIVNKKKTIQEKTLENFLTSQEQNLNPQTLNEIEEMYGDEFNSFTQLQKVFIKKNINNFQIITQRVLNRMGYPRTAAKMLVGGVNIVEFFLHPNGDISDLKLAKESSYASLDENTIELIKIAYKEYPKPKTITKIKFRVIYRIY